MGFVVGVTVFVVLDFVLSDIVDAKVVDVVDVVIVVVEEAFTDSFAYETSSATLSLVTLGSELRGDLLVFLLKI